MENESIDEDLGIIALGVMVLLIGMGIYYRSKPYEPLAESYKYHKLVLNDQVYSATLDRGDRVVTLASNDLKHCYYIEDNKDRCRYYELAEKLTPGLEKTVLKIVFNCE